MTWWVLTRKRIVPSYDHALITFRTSSPDHCFMAWAYHQPRRHPIIRFLRGRPRVCGYRYIWDTPFIAEQAASGDTEHHQIQITDLIPGSTIYFYLFAPDGPYGLEIQGPLQAFVLPPGPPPPVPTDVPIGFTVASPIFRCGNRYTFWANTTWYAMVPTPGGLEMHKLVGGVMMRQDQLNEPTPPAGAIADADSRLRNDAAAIHCAYICRVPDPGPHLLRHATFDLTTDTWALDEQICTPLKTIFVQLDTSLSLDTNNRPHVVYTDYSNAYPQIHYRNKLTAAWSDAEVAIGRMYRTMMLPSLTCDPRFSVVRLASVTSYYEHFYAKRQPWDEEWGAPEQMATAVNTPDNSIASGQDPGHVAQIGTDWRVNHYDVSIGFIGDQDLTLPTCRYANMIVPWESTPGVAIVYRDRFNHVAYIWQPQDGSWSDEHPVTDTPLLVLSAHYAHPDAISCLYTQIGPPNLCFHAFYAPWH